MGYVIKHVPGGLVHDKKYNSLIISKIINKKFG